LDADILDKAYKALFAKGQSMTGLYRFLAKNGGYVWMETQATVIGDSQLDRARSIVCINHVISEIECRNLILADVQLPRLHSGSDKPLQQAAVAKRQQPVLVAKQQSPVPTAVAKPQQVSAASRKKQRQPLTVSTCCSKASSNVPTVKLNPTMQRSDKQPLCVITSNVQSPQKDKQQQQKKSDDENYVDVVDVEDDDDDDTEASSNGMQFMTEKLLSSRGVVMPSSLLSSSATSAAGVRGTLRNVSSCSSLDHILDDLDCGLDMRAPYIPMEDMIFAASSQSSEAASFSPKHSTTSSPIDLTVCSANTLDVDVMNALFSCTRSVNTSSASTVDTVVDSTVDRPLSQPTKRPLSDHVFILPASKLFRGSLVPSDAANQSTTATEVNPTFTTSAPTTASSCSVSGSSVLLNLLTTGVDSNWGYKLCSNQSNNEVEGTANAALTSLLRHLLNPSSPEPSTTGGSSGNAGVNCVSGSELLFHVTSLPTGDK
jgi:hypothetical protein